MTYATDVERLQRGPVADPALVFGAVKLLQDVDAR
jgi:hypothetical protein